jgi:isocitrate/isopropylmalate dehydrogenase
MNSKIVVLAGDGIGPEIMDSGLQVLAAVEKKCAHTFELEELPFGGAGILLFMYLLLSHIKVFIFRKCVSK